MQIPTSHAQCFSTSFVSDIQNISVDSLTSQMMETYLYNVFMLDVALCCDKNVGLALCFPQHIRTSPIVLQLAEF